MELQKTKITEELEITTNSQDSLFQIIEQKLQNKEAFRIVTFNPEMLIQSLNDSNFLNSVKSADAIIPDGIGLVYLLRKKGANKVSRVPGIELSWQVLAKTMELNLPIAIVGSKDESLNLAISNIENKLGKINLVYKHNGFFDTEKENNILEKLIELQPSLVLFAMPFSRQEILLNRLFESGLKSVGIGVGGSVDVWSGNIQRAPKFMQIIGLEWLWRVILQPQRIGRIIRTFVPFLQIYLRP